MHSCYVIGWNDIISQGQCPEGNVPNQMAESAIVSHEWNTIVVVNKDGMCLVSIMRDN